MHPTAQRLGENRSFPSVSRGILRVLYRISRSVSHVRSILASFQRKAKILVQRFLRAQKETTERSFQGQIIHNSLQSSPSTHGFDSHHLEHKKPFDIQRVALAHGMYQKNKTHCKRNNLGQTDKPFSDKHPLRVVGNYLARTRDCKRCNLVGLYKVHRSGNRP